MDALLTLMFLLLPLVPPLTVLAIVRWGPFPNRWWQGERVLGFAFTVGTIAFALGFFGPMVLIPESNLGPLIGFLYTGPAGFVVGLTWGALRAWGRRTR